MTILYSTITGSRAYGTAVAESDTDIRGVFIAPRADIVGPWGYAESKTGAGEDETYWELRHFLRLAASANPNVLEVLFTPADCMRYISYTGRMLFKARKMCLTKRIARTYLGFADSCLKKMLSGRYGTGARDETGGQRGVDFKFGMHAVRILETGIDALRTGEMRVRRDNADWLLSIRKGEHPIEHVESWIRCHKIALGDAEYWSRLPDEPDREAVSRLCVEISEMEWNASPCVEVRL